MAQPLLRFGRISRASAYANCTRALGSRGFATQHTQSNHELYDVVCVGGGPAGLSLLTGLSMNAASILLAGASVNFG